MIYDLYKEQRCQYGHARTFKFQRSSEKDEAQNQRAVNNVKNEMSAAKERGAKSRRTFNYFNHSRSTNSWSDKGEKGLDTIFQIVNNLTSDGARIEEAQFKKMPKSLKYEGEVLEALEGKLVSIKEMAAINQIDAIRDKYDSYLVLGMTSGVDRLIEESGESQESMQDIGQDLRTNDDVYKGRNTVSDEDASVEAKGGERVSSGSVGDSDGNVDSSTVTGSPAGAQEGSDARSKRRNARLKRKDQKLQTLDFPNLVEQGYSFTSLERTEDDRRSTGYPFTTLEDIEDSQESTSEDVES